MPQMIQWIKGQIFGLWTQKRSPRGTGKMAACLAFFSPKPLRLKAKSQNEAVEAGAEAGAEAEAGVEAEAPDKC